MARVIAREEVVLDHPPERVYGALCELGAYERWWPAPFRFLVLGPSRAHLGLRMRMATGRFTWWTAEVTQLRENERIALRYDDGAWRGEAAFILAREGSGTRLALAVDIEPASAWHRLTALFVDLSARHARQARGILDALDRRLRSSADETSGRKTS